MEECVAAAGLGQESEGLRQVWFKPHTKRLDEMVNHSAGTLHCFQVNISLQKTDRRERDAETVGARLNGVV
jgi:hypothetical protein